MSHETDTMPRKVMQERKVVVEPRRFHRWAALVIVAAWMQRGEPAAR